MYPRAPTRSLIAPSGAIAHVDAAIGKSKGMSRRHHPIVAAIYDRCLAPSSPRWFCAQSMIENVQRSISTRVLKPRALL